SIHVDESASITITTPISGDDVINAAESGQNLAIRDRNSVVEADKIVTVTLHGVDSTAAVQADGSWSATVLASTLGGLTDGSNYTVSAHVSGVAGNPASNTSSIHVDESASITITTPISGDDVINAAESGQNLAI